MGPGTEGRMRRLLQLGWPKLAMEHALEPVETEALEAVRSWSPSTRNMLVLVGDRGSGKTVAATWRALRDPRPSFYSFAHAGEVARLGRYSREWATVMNAPALCLDDVGSEYLDKHGSFASDFEELLNKFYSMKRPLVITVNITAKEFGTRYGGRVVDRLVEAGRWVTIRDSSMRRGLNETLPWDE